MKLSVYSVRDSKADCYMVPFFVSNDAVALRMIANASCDSESMLSANSEDFSLYSIGEFDSDSGVILPLPAPKFMSSVVSLKGITERD